MAAFNNSFTDKLSYIEATAIVDRLPFRMDFSVKNGKIIKSDAFEKEIENNAMLESGRYFTDKEYRDGERVAVCWDYFHWNTMSSPVSKRMAVDKNTLRIQGKNYKIIAYGIIDIDRPVIPVTSLDDTTIFHENIVFHFKKPIRQDQYNIVSQKTDKILGERAVVEPADLPYDDAVYLYNTIIMVTIFITIVSAINFAILYRYILSSRKQSLMVYRICGMSLARVVLLYLGECVLLTVPAYFTGVMLFEHLILKKIAGYYDYMSSSYNIDVYLVLFSVYFIFSLLIIFLMILHALHTDSKLNVKGGVR